MKVSLKERVELAKQDSYLGPKYKDLLDELWREVEKLRKQLQDR